MNWIEVSLHTDGEAVEAIADLLQQYGYQGVAIEQLGIVADAWEDDLPAPTDMIVRAYLPDDAQAPERKRRRDAGLNQLAQLYQVVPRQPAYTIVQEQDWAEAWKVHYKPVRIGRQICVRPEWCASEAGPGDLEIILDPGTAFGTGTHPSTQLCLIALEDLPRPLPAHGLDLGCGSGILAIAAAKLGVEHLWALDIDQLAVDATLRNAGLNAVSDRLTAQQGSRDALLASGRPFGLILGITLAMTLIPMCQQGLGRLVEPGGVAIFSGLIHEQADDVEAALRATGLLPVRRRTMGDWVGIEARKEA